MGIPRSGFRPLIVRFEDRSSYSAAYTRVWDFPGGIPTSATGLVVPAVRYEAAGTYRVRLTIELNGQFVEEKDVDAYITVYELIDFGDAPDSSGGPLTYRTLLENDGASHIINNVYHWRILND